MASIQTGIELQDNFTSVLYGIINAANMAVYTMDDMQSAMNADIDTSSIADARDEIEQTTAAVEEMNAALQSQMNQSVVNTDAIPTTSNQIGENQQPQMTPIQPNAPPEPVTIPVQWESDGLEVFSTTGYERFQQEVQSANGMLNALNQTQASIEQTASGLDILPDAAIQDINSLGQRLQTVQQRMQQIENNPVNMNSDTANAELEQLRGQLNNLIQLQNNLNAAMESADVSDINAAYLNLSQNISTTERYIRDNTDEQGRFNQEIQEGVGQADSLMNTIKGAVAAYVSIQSVGKALNISDELVQTTSCLNMMNDGLQTTEELTNMVYAAAQDARGSFSDMANVVARFGNNAKDAFSSSAEVVAFADLVQKQMTIAGASTQEAGNAMLQLSQGLGSGVLRGDELNSIFEQAPNLIQNIADYLQVPIGKIREMASEGELTADIVKAAIFSATDEINANFEQMPMTWGQIWQSFKNTAMIAFRPVLNKINEIANSESFQNFVNTAIEWLSILAGVVLDVFDFMGSCASFVADNWSIISPIIWGIIAALAVYGAYLAITKGLELASAAASAVLTGAKLLGAAALAIFTGANFAATASQWGLNAAMYACPIVWIIVLIIALIAVIYAVCAAIAKMTGIANSGFGVITGGVNVVIQFFKNLALSVANIALGIDNALNAVAFNMLTAFSNAIKSIQSFFYGLASTALDVVATIASALNKLPFISFDVEGITGAADDYAKKKADIEASKGTYTDIGAAFNNGINTFDTFKDGWISDAFNSGASWGDGVADSIGNFDPSSLFDGADIPNPDEYTSQFAEMGDSLGSISSDTEDISDSLDVTEEEMKYLRDIAEQEAVNRFTTAEITIEQTNNNNVSGGMDLDGIVSALSDAVDEATEIIVGKGD